MQPGRELDCLIAEKIFGYKKEEHICGENDFFIKNTKLTYWIQPNKDFPVVVKRDNEPPKDLYANRLPHYSTSLDSAWLIVDWILSKGFTFTLEKIIKEKCWEINNHNFKLKIGIVTRANTPEMAICKLGLKLATPVFCATCGKQTKGNKFCSQECSEYEDLE